MNLKKIFQAGVAWLRGLFAGKQLTERMQLGMKGEQLAAAHLRHSGMKIVMRNWRNGHDEIDIVARDGVELVFVEVKTRTRAASTSDRANGYFAVDRRKRHALARAGRAYMRAMEKPPAHYRLDIVEVEMAPEGGHEIFHHRAVPLFEANQRNQRGYSPLRGRR